MSKYKIIYYSGKGNQIKEKEVTAQYFQVVCGGIEFIIDTRPCYAFSSYVSVEKIDTKPIKMKCKYKTKLLL